MRKLFSETVESVRIFDIDEYSAARALDSVLAVLKRKEFASAHSLQIVSGDDLILTANRAGHAVRIALELAEKLAAAESGPEPKGISIRMAITYGALVVGEHVLHGRFANIAARLADSALAEEVLQTEGVPRHLSLEFDRKIQDRGVQFRRKFPKPMRRQISVLAPQVIPRVSLGWKAVNFFVCGAWLEKWRHCHRYGGR